MNRYTEFVKIHCMFLVGYWVRVGYWVMGMGVFGYIGICVLHLHKFFVFWEMLIEMFDINILGMNKNARNLQNKLYF